MENDSEALPYNPTLNLIKNLILLSEMEIL